VRAQCCGPAEAGATRFGRSRSAQRSLGEKMARCTAQRGRPASRSRSAGVAQQVGRRGASTPAAPPR
jgi:hypothetical protein